MSGTTLRMTYSTVTSRECQNCGSPNIVVKLRSPTNCSGPRMFQWKRLRARPPAMGRMMKMTVPRTVGRRYRYGTSERWPRRARAGAARVRRAAASPVLSMRSSATVRLLSH
jgi:DNA-directed RNA polymerase subunit RPC12/RpoP